MDSKSKWIIGGGIAAGVLLLAGKSRGASSVRPGTPLISGNQYWDWPVPASSYLTSPFGYRNDPFGSGARVFHNGIDLANLTDTPIFAAAAGPVTESKKNAVSGNFVGISHGAGWKSYYAHLDFALVKAGDRVVRGQLIGAMDNTGASKGSHVHFMTTLNGEAKDPQVVIGRWGGKRASGLSLAGTEMEDVMRYGADLDLAVRQSVQVDPNNPLGGMGCCGTSVLGGFDAYDGTPSQYTVEAGDDVRLSAIARKLGLSAPQALNPAEHAAVAGSGWEGALGAAKLIAAANGISWGPPPLFQTFPVVLPGRILTIPSMTGGGGGGGGGLLLAAAAAFLLLR